MALDKLKHQYTEPLQVSSLSVDGNLNASNVIINGVIVTPSTYLTTSNASTTYLTISNAASTYGSLIASNTFTADNTFSPTSTTSIPVTINTPNASISNALVLNQNGSTKAIITAAGQTLINSSLPILGSVNQSVGFVTASTASSTTVATYTSSSSTNPFVTGIYTNFYNITPSYFNGTFLVTATGGSTNAWTATVYNPAATFTASGTGTAFGAFRGTATFSITSHNTYSPTLIVKPASNGTANLTEWQSSASATVRYIDSNGASISTLSDTAASFIPTSSTVPVNGMFLPVANTVAISTNTAETMRIDSTGNVSIATTSTNIRGSSGGKFLTLAGGSLPGAVLELYNTNTDGTGNYGTIVFGANAAGLAANKSIAQVEAYTAGTTANNRGGILIFSTKADGGALAVRLTIDNTGLSTFSGTVSATAAPGTTTSASQLGYIGLPQNLNPTSYTITAADNGKHIYYTTSGQTLTIPANGTLALPIGFSFVIINAAAVTTSIAITTDTLILAGTGSTGTRTLAAYGMATLVKITATSWMISGNGLT